MAFPGAGAGRSRRARMLDEVPIGGKRHRSPERGPGPLIHYVRVLYRARKPDQRPAGDPLGFPWMRIWIGLEFFGPGLNFLGIPWIGFGFPWSFLDSLGAKIIGFQGFPGGPKRKFVFFSLAAAWGRRSTSRQQRPSAHILKRLRAPLRAGASSRVADKGVSSATRRT